MGCGLKGGVSAQKRRPLGSLSHVQLNRGFENLHFQLREGAERLDTWAARPVKLPLCYTT